MKSKYLFLLILLLSVYQLNTLAADKITLNRIEPANWWVGMKNPELQLLVYGENIGSTDVKISIPGVTLNSILKVENKNYLFLNLTISKEATPGIYPIEFYKDKKLVIKKDFPLLKRENGAEQRHGFNSSDAIYLLMPDRFSNGNPANDSATGVFEKPDRKNPGGRHGGDIQGIINHLDYLKDLGFTALWSTPLNEDNMESYSYHTYAITDYYKIDPRYGTNQDYKRLGDELHKRSMKLIMDVVPNHCGLNYYWMKDMPTKDWVHQFKEFTRSNYQISTTYDPYASEYDKNLDYNGWFDTSMPDLNQDNPLVLTYLIQNTIWWIEYAGLDGIRIDTYPYNNPEKIAIWSKSVCNEYPGINIVGECWVHTSQEIAYWQKGSKNYDGYVSELPTVMDFALHDTYSSAINESDGWGSGMRRFYNHFTLDYIFPNPFNLLIFTENHDTQRFNELINGDIRKYKIAYTILFTIRGIPQFYYGSEVMMRGNKDKGDGDIRRDFPGGWPGDVKNAFEALGRTALENESYEFIKKLLNWRKSNPVIHSGKTTQFISQGDCYIYFRYNQEKTVMVVINNHDTESRKLDTKRFAERMNGFKSGVDIISGKKISDLSTLDLAPKSSMIIELSK